MDSTPVAPAVFDREFLTIRARLIDLAAALDRVARAGELTAEDPRTEQIRRSLEVLLKGPSARAEQVQMVFSLPYDPDWQAKFAREKK